MASISLMNVIWLQSAPTAFEHISWKFYLCFIIPAFIFAIICLFFYPNTKGLALEEIAALFGDEVRTDIPTTAAFDNVHKKVETAREKTSELSDSYVEHHV